MIRALEERYAEQERLVELARGHVETLSRRLRIHQAAVVGSVARGDFNLWSDVDVVIVAGRLPERMPERMALLMAGRPPRVEPIGFTPEELEVARSRGNRLVVELDSVGVALI